MEFRDDGDQNNEDEVIEKLVVMFGNVISKDVIVAVVESCNGDLNESVEGIMNIAGEVPPSPPPDVSGGTSNANNMRKRRSPRQKKNQGSQRVDVTSQNDMQLNAPQQQTSYATAEPQQQTSYATAFKNTVALPNKTDNRPIVLPNPNVSDAYWTVQFRQIIKYHNDGTRVMIIMRGASGSGKSYLANKLLENTVGPTSVSQRGHIFSTDDYFMNTRGQYVFDRTQLHDAHLWNQQRVRMAAVDGLSPIVVDNTNIEIWEMEPYVRDAVFNGYIIELMEPKTPWAKSPHALCQRSTHDVPIHKINMMLSNFQRGLTSEILIKRCRVSYSSKMVPPVLRKIPAFVKDELTPHSSRATAQRSTAQSKIVAVTSASSISSQSNDQLPNAYNSNLGHSSKNPDVNKVAESEEIQVFLSNDEDQDSEACPDDLKGLEESQELMWENDGHCDAQSQPTAVNNVDSSNVKLFPSNPPNNDNAVDPGPRNVLENTEVVTTPAQTLMESVNKCQDWSNISMFMPPWDEATPSTSAVIPALPVETVSSSTCMEIGDTVISNDNNHKIISATSRDINMFHVTLGDEKIPNKRMFDKSTSTNEQLLTGSQRCENEEKHFITFRKLFRNIPLASLRDIFDQCCGDVNWAVDIVLDGMSKNQIPTMETEEQVEEDDEVIEPCPCLAAYNIIPDSEIKTTIKKTEVVTETTEVVPLPQKKAKKEVTLSDTSLQLKRQIEQNVVISEDHYSNHTLKIRKMYRGENKDDEVAGPSNVQEEPSTPQEGPSTSDAAAAIEEQNDDDNSDDDDDGSIDELYDQKFVDVYLEAGFIKQLDALFGRSDMEYPECVLPKISIPMSTLNEINALWMESVMNQLEKEARQSELMLKQDEEFARQLAAKEEEMARAGIEPPIPDFKEIMDMDLALSIYNKDVNGWRSKEPNDLASKLSRDKLYYLFPDLPQDTLAEMLSAHNYDFKHTVEVLLVSTGREEILKKENGVNKFVMEKEFERKEKVLSEERKALSEAEWPFLSNTAENVDMETVNGYRLQAQKHLLRRNLNYTKAREYIRRGMTQVALYYSDIAAFHKERFDYSNNLAAASLMQVNATNAKDAETIDLHYMRVSEAQQSLDVFIDTHIELLKRARARGAPRFSTLFIITGRGLHSPAGPKIKPAVKIQLTKRGLNFNEKNPGLLTARVCADDLLTHEVGSP